MKIPKKVTEFLKENENEPRENVIKNMILRFNYKRSTAISYYSNKNFKVRNKKEIVFNFLKMNPEALRNNVLKKYVKKLGINKATYLKYKSQYLLINQTEAEKVKQIPSRPREKFIFDDSML
jgi:hypothetical protein